MSSSRIPAVKIAGITKNYGAVEALKGIDLEVAAGEYFVLLGPSGGGKTTLLRLIGGFIKPNRGELFLHGQDVSNLPPDKRPTSMVFQSYALFPHMNVARNVGYGLRLKNLPSAEIKNKVDAMLDMVGLANLGDRRPHELSGGQQQRVQLARSLVLERDILLLDEPLAALDANLRKDMCYELKRLQEQVGITFIHVTHNQEEAMTVADRIAIIADGKLIEHGNARDIYRNPVQRFTAEFIGENNIFDGEVAQTTGNNVTLTGDFGLIVVNAHGDLPAVGARISISIRSESMQIVTDKSAGDSKLQTITAKYHETIYLGLVTRHTVILQDGQRMTLRAISDMEDSDNFCKGQEVLVGWQTESGRLHLS